MVAGDLTVLAPYRAWGHGAAMAKAAAIDRKPKEPEGISAPDFRHIDAWVFDLDNTLYRADCNLFEQIDRRMTVYIAQLLSMPEADAKRIQKIYYRDHGTTLSGLMRVNGIDPEAFLDFVHDIDLSVLHVDESLTRAIAKLPGRKFVFTNGCHNHAVRILERVGLTDLIDDIWDIRTIAYTPKPDIAAYETVIAKSGLAPRTAAMFEDVARNLVPAHTLGMTTVWLNNNSVWSKQGPEFPLVTSEHIHHEITDLAQFLHSIRI